MMINSEYLRLLNEFALTEREVSEGLFFGFLMSLKDKYPDLESYMLDGQDSVFPYEKFQMYSINLCKVNLETGKNELKVPLFGYSADGEYEKFIALLEENYIGSRGHVNNQKAFSIISEEAAKEFYTLKAKINPFDINRLVQVTVDYYRNTEYAKKLAGYLAEIAIYDYKSMHINL